jgi:hypothetical protein
MLLRGPRNGKPNTNASERGRLLGALQRRILLSRTSDIERMIEAYHPEIVSTRMIRERPYGVWYEALGDSLVGFIDIPHVVDVSNHLDDSEFAQFVAALGLVLDVAADIHVGARFFWEPPDWAAVRMQVYIENPDAEWIIARVWEHEDTLH